MISTGENGITRKAQEGSPAIKSMDQDPNFLSAMGKGSSKPGGAYILSLAR